jgi:estrogen-related receptor beta like 1
MIISVLFRVRAQADDVAGAGDDDDADESVLGADAVAGRAAHGGDAHDAGTGGNGGNGAVITAGVLQSAFESAAWRMEVERVLPQLKVAGADGGGGGLAGALAMAGGGGVGGSLAVAAAAAARDWRGHREALGAHVAEVARAQGGSAAALARLHADVGRTLEKIDSRERYLNRQLEQHVAEYRAQQDRLAAARAAHGQAAAGVTALTRELAAVGDELDAVKAQTDERGSSMTDAAPLVRIRQAHARLKADITDAELRLGMAQHAVLAARLRAKAGLVRDLNSRPLAHAAAY